MHGYLFDPLTSRPKSQMFFRRMQQDRDFPTETHQRLCFDFFVFFFRIALWYITIKPPSGRICLEFFQASEADQKNDDLTSEYLTGHVPKKHLPPFQRLRDCWLLFLSVIDRVTMVFCIYYYLKLFGDSEIGTTPRFRSISGPNQLEAVTLEVVVATILSKRWCVSMWMMIIF